MNSKHMVVSSLRLDEFYYNFFSIYVNLKYIAISDFKLGGYSNNMIVFSLKPGTNSFM